MRSYFNESRLINTGTYTGELILTKGYQTAINDPFEYESIPTILL